MKNRISILLRQLSKLPPDTWPPCLVFTRLLTITGDDSATRDKVGRWTCGQWIAYLETL